MELLYKRVTFDVKATAGDGPGTWEAVLSTPSLDRDGEVVAAKAFEPLPMLIPVHTDHNMTVAGLVGSGRPFYDGDTLKINGTFASANFAQLVRTMILEGHLTAMSVGFRGLGGGREVRDGVPTWVKGELLEASFATVPANRDALIGGAKSFTGDERKSITGSYEALREQLQGALRAAGVGGYVMATFADSVVYEAWDETYTQRLAYQAPYSIAEGVVTLGAGESIEITEVIAPKKSVAAPAAKPAADPGDPQASPEFWAKAIPELQLT